MMKSKILNALLLVTSVLGYLEWGTNNHLFLFQAEAEIIGKLFNNNSAVIHPFTMLPLLGQFLLLLTLFQSTPGKLFTMIGIGSLGLLLLFMCLIGIVSLNPKIFFSTLPFLVTSIITIKYHWKKKRPTTPIQNS